MVLMVFYNIARCLWYWYWYCMVLRLALLRQLSRASQLRAATNCLRRLKLLEPIFYSEIGATTAIVLIIQTTPGPDAVTSRQILQLCAKEVYISATNFPLIIFHIVKMLMMIVGRISPLRYLSDTY